MSKIVRSLGLFLAAALLAASAAAGQSREFRKTLPLDATGRLSIDNYKGSITIATSTASEASIEARIEPDPDGDAEDQAKKVAQTEIRVRGGGSSVEVETNYSELGRSGFLGLSEGTRPLVHYTIRMPATARLEIDDYKSSIRIDGLHAALRIETYKGIVAVAGQDGAVDVKTYKGDVTVSYARFSGPARFDTYKGDVAVRLPGSSEFEIDADMGRRGDFSSDFALAVEHRGQRDDDGGSVRGSVGAGGPTLSFETHKGRLTLRKG